MNITPRKYQLNIFEKAKLYNTLVVLPTGLGKTMIAIMLIENRLKNYPNSKVLFLAPTRPLVEQHKKTLEKIFDEPIAMFIGTINSKKRKALLQNHRIIIATPQTIQNDIISKNIELENISLLIIDEAHRATKQYAYVFIAQQYKKQAKYSRILALTASPGHDKEKILEICNNLFIEHIETRSKYDPDVKQYIQKTEVRWVEVKLNKELEKIRTLYQDIKNETIKKFNKLELIKLSSKPSKKTILLLQKEIRTKFSDNPKIYEASHLISILVKINHCIELLETQGLTPLYNYILDMKQQYFSSSTKAIKKIINDIRFNSAFLEIKKLLDVNFEHPKLDKLKEIMIKFKQTINGKAIIFTQIRDEVNKIKEELDNLGINNEIFIGQGKRKGKGKGLSQKEQSKVIEKLKNNEINCIVSTSVGEEGLDIPEVDLVIFYEPIPSAVRTIQRRGRTGRQSKGIVLILYTKDTIDETYKWISIRQEKKMYNNLKEIRDLFLIKNINNFKQINKNNKTIERTIKKIKPKETTLEYFSQESTNQTSQITKQQETTIKTNKKRNTNITTINKINYINNNQDNYKSKNSNDKKDTKITIIVDHREKNTALIKELINKDANIILEKLPIGDYLVSSKTAIEFKTAQDFIRSIIDSRIFQQVKELKRAYEKPIVIISPYDEIFNTNMHINAILGALVNLATKNYIPILFARNLIETATMIYTIAKQEQDSSKYISVKKPKTNINEQIKYTTSTIPGIGYILSEPLLKHFKTLKNIANAKPEELAQLNNIGEIRARKIFEFFNKEYF